MNKFEATGRTPTPEPGPEGNSDSPVPDKPEQENIARQKRPGYRRLFFYCVGALTLYLIGQTISINRYGFRDSGRKAHCAIVLGGAAWHDKPSPVFRERLNHAISLYIDKRVTALVLTGGKGTGAPYSEGEVARDYCLKRGIPEEALFMEGNSRTTVQNLEEASRILDQQGFTSALIVSDPWHLKRGVLIARRQGMEAFPSGTTTSRFESFKSRASFTMRELYLYHLYLFLNR